MQSTVKHERHTRLLADGARLSEPADDRDCCCGVDAGVRVLFFNSGGTPEHGEDDLLGRAERPRQACRRLPFRTHTHTLHYHSHCHIINDWWMLSRA